MDRKGRIVLLEVAVLVSSLAISFAVSQQITYYGLDRGGYAEYQLPHGTVRFTINDQPAPDIYNLTVSYGNGSTKYEMYLPVTWQESNFLPWFIYIPSTGNPVYGFGGSVTRGVIHVGNSYKYSLGNITVYWEDKFGILTELDVNNTRLVYRTATNFWYYETNIAAFDFWLAIILVLGSAVNLVLDYLGNKGQKGKN